MIADNNEEIITINPATGDEIKRYPLMSNEEADHAVEECHNAFLEWREVSMQDRAEVLASIADKLQQHKDELAELMTQEMGKLLTHSKQEVDLVSAICNWTAENGPDELQDEERDLVNGGRGIITYSPIGVVYGIQPWNWPSYQVIRYTVANLLTGNGVLLKHAESVTGSALLLDEIFDEAGVPENLFTVLRITHEQSDKIIEHEKVRGVTFTGSAAAGRTVAQKASSELKKTVLELGSNDAFLILSDADVAYAAQACVTGRIYNNGESCIAAKRFVVVDDVYEEFKNKYVQEMKTLKTGDPDSDDSDIGPIAREDLWEKLIEQVEKSVEKGATVLCGGEQLDRPGFFYPATVLADVQPGQPAYDEELFGPVSSIIRAENDEDAMRIANDSRFGLGGGIFSEDEGRAIDWAQNYFDTGMVFINSYNVPQPDMPFGGVKDSGYGREHGGFGVKEFANAKAVMLFDSSM
jgi:succinate-semialdehyde dehydrogenase/glutarate-semialdehyde dehydrogenase